MYEVYMLECRDGSLYTGIAQDADKRLTVHLQGKGSKYVRSRLPARLVYRETQPDHAAALRREYAIKHMSRQEKLQLIASARQAHSQ